MIYGEVRAANDIRVLKKRPGELDSKMRRIIQMKTTRKERYCGHFNNIQIGELDRIRFFGWQI